MKMIFGKKKKDNENPVQKNENGEEKIEGKPLLYLVFIVLALIVATAGLDRQGFFLKHAKSEVEGSMTRTATGAPAASSKNNKVEKVKEDKLLETIVNSKAAGFVGKTKTQLDEKLGDLSLNQNNNMSSTVWGTYAKSDYEFSFSNPDTGNGGPDGSWVCDSVDSVKLSDVFKDAKKESLDIKGDALKLCTSETPKGIQYYLQGDYQDFKITIWDCNKEGNTSKNSTIELQSVEQTDTLNAQATDSGETKDVAGGKEKKQSKKS